MLTFEEANDGIMCHADPESLPTTPEQIVDALASSIDVNVIGIENDGAPVFLGNPYAEYRLRILLPRRDDLEHVIGVGQMEADALNAKRHALIAIEE